MSKWTVCKLGEIVSIKGGKRMPKGVNLIKTPNSHPYIRIRDLGKSKYLELDSSYEYVDDKTYKSISRYIVNEGDILLSIVGTIGIVGVVGKSLNLASQTENCVKLTNFKNIDRDYLYYYLLSNIGQSEIQKGIVGAVQAKLPIKNILDISIVLPPIYEQKRIAAILGALDDKIELNRHINANLEEQAKALYKSWFVDFEPFKDAGFVDSELGSIPAGWKIGSIYTYMDVIYGAPYKSSLFNTNKKGLPLIRIRDLKTYSPQFYTEEILPNTEYIECGDIVAGMDAEFIPCIWRGDKGLLNQRVCKFIPKYDYVSNFYIYSAIRPELEFVQSYKVGTTVSHLGKSDIDKFKVIIPPINIIEQYSRIVDSYLAEIIKVANENRRLAILRDTLLPKLMSGEISL